MPADGEKVTYRLLMDGHGNGIYLETCRRTVEPVAEITDELIQLGKEQYQKERDASGDPPRSIGNEWLLYIGRD